MDSKKNVYLITYSDNKNALFLKDYSDNTKINRDFLSRLIESSLNIEPFTIHIDIIQSFFWKIGTHYFEPMKKGQFKGRQEFIRHIQHPEPNMLVVGEAVSRRQGWTEGALLSVNTGLTKKWLFSLN
jgi:hypothetical protein